MRLRHRPSMGRKTISFFVKMKNKAANLTRKNHRPTRKPINLTSWNTGSSRTNVRLPWANINP
jgi:hypothetical protein